MPTPPAALTALLSLAALLMLSLALATRPGADLPPTAHGGGNDQAGPVQAEPARPVSTTVQQTLYPVSGGTAEAILVSMVQAAPETDAETFFGLTTTALSFRYRREQQPDRREQQPDRREQQPDRCTLADVRVDLSVSVELPQWTRPADAPYDLARDWARFDTALRRHEDRHRVLAQDGAEALRSALDRLSAPTCAEADLNARHIADRVNIETEAAHRRYDDETGHGATQGANWPLRR